MTVGLPRSGKSTWAQEQTFPIVNPDSIRLALHGEPFIKAAEPMVWCLAKYMVKALFNAGHFFVILDATNITKERRDFWMNDDWECLYQYFSTSKETCIERAIKSHREDLIPVIERMAKERDFDLINGEVRLNGL